MGIEVSVSDLICQTEHVVRTPGVSAFIARVTRWLLPLDAGSIDGCLRLWRSRFVVSVLSCLVVFAAAVDTQQPALKRVVLLITWYQVALLPTVLLIGKLGTPSLRERLWPINRLRADFDLGLLRALLRQVFRAAVAFIPLGLVFSMDAGLLLFVWGVDIATHVLGYEWFVFVPILGTLAYLGAFAVMLSTLGAERRRACARVSVAMASITVPNPEDKAVWTARSNRANSFVRQLEVTALTVGLISGVAQILDLRLDRTGPRPTVLSTLLWVLSFAAIDRSLFTIIAQGRHAPRAGVE
jgi:hypothetical protein